jgi:hypothetical protein
LQVGIAPMAAGFAPDQHPDIAGAQRGSWCRWFVVSVVRGGRRASARSGAGQMAGAIPPRDMLIRDIIARLFPCQHRVRLPWCMVVLGENHHDKSVADCCALLTFCRCAGRSRTHMWPSPYSR